MATAALPDWSTSSGVVVASMGAARAAATPLTCTGAFVAYQPNTAVPWAVYCSITGEVPVSTLRPVASPRVGSPCANRHAERTPKAAA
jgi:hypothetical protein